MSAYRKHFKRIIHRYPVVLPVDHIRSPRPHQVEVPYDFAYAPIRGYGRYYLFLTEQDRDDFAQRYSLEIRSMKRKWPPEQFR